ncbi:MAG: hypothetical protein AM326_03370 [Candidatus Thorarchaeota archaeon SMTZ-45]|nr:MAG: hypothetical protein AM326_03370 [Candidatus Thorarchaeota archaeon SMTZ-45]
MKVTRFLALLLVLLGMSSLAQAQITTVRGEDENEWKRTLKTDTKGRLQGVQAQKVLHNCDSKADWTALSNDTTGIDEDLDHVEGAKSLEFDKVDGTDNTKLGGIQKTITSVDISHYMENNGFIMVSLNVSATTDIDYCFIRLGTDGSNYNEWRVDDDALSAGWQQIRFAFYAPSTAGNLGNGMAATAITYLALGCAFDLETSLLADIRVDNIAINTGFQTSADLSSQVSSAVATPNVNVLKIASQPVDMGAGNVGVGTQRVIAATDDPNLSKLSAWDDGADRAKVNVEHDWKIDGMDSTSGWAVANDATANIALSSNHVQGTGSLTFDKVNGTNFTEGYIEKTITSLDLNDYEAHNVIEWKMYLSSLGDVAYVFLRLGTDSSNYSEWRVIDEDLTAGKWNPISMFAGDLQYAVVGTGMDSTAVTYVAVGASFDAEDDLLSGIGVDDIDIHETAHTTASIAAEVKTSVTTANINLQKVGNKTVDRNVGASGDGTLRVVNATDDPNLSKMTVMDLDTTGSVDNRQVAAIVTQSATGAVLNSPTAPLYTSSAGSVSVTASAGPTATDTTPDLILAAQDVAGHPSWGLQLINNGGGSGSALSDADVQVSRDGGTTWFSLTWTACDNLAASASCDYDFPLNSYTNIRVYTTAVVDTTATVNFSSVK